MEANSLAEGTGHDIYNCLWRPWCFGLDVGVDLGMALIGTGPLDFLSHRLQHLDSQRGSLAELLDSGCDGLLMSVQQWFWRLCNTWSDASTGELAALEWWAGRSLEDDARATVVGLSAAVWCRIELKCPEIKPQTTV